MTSTKRFNLEKSITGMDLMNINDEETNSIKRDVNNNSSLANYRETNKTKSDNILTKSNLESSNINIAWKRLSVKELKEMYEKKEHPVKNNENERFSIIRNINNANSKQEPTEYLNNEILKNYKGGSNKENIIIQEKPKKASNSEINYNTETKIDGVDLKKYDFDLGNREDNGKKNSQDFENKLKLFNSISKSSIPEYRFDYSRFKEYNGKNDLEYKKQGINNKFNEDLFQTSVSLEDNGKIENGRIIEFDDDLDMEEFDKKNKFICDSHLNVNDNKEISIKQLFKRIPAENNIVESNLNNVPSTFYFINDDSLVSNSIRFSFPNNSSKGVNCVGAKNEEAKFHHISNKSSNLANEKNIFIKAKAESQDRKELDLNNEQIQQSQRNIAVNKFSEDRKNLAYYREQRRRSLFNKSLIQSDYLTDYSYCKDLDKIKQLNKSSTIDACNNYSLIQQGNYKEEKNNSVDINHKRKKLTRNSSKDSSFDSSNSSYGKNNLEGAKKTAIKLKRIEKFSEDVFYNQCIENSNTENQNTGKPEVLEESKYVKIEKQQEFAKTENFNDFKQKTYKNGVITNSDTNVKDSKSINKDLTSKSKSNKTLRSCCHMCYIF